MRKFISGIAMLALTASLGTTACKKKSEEQGGGGGGGAAQASGKKAIDEAQANELVKTEVPGFEVSMPNVMGSFASMWLQGTEANAGGFVASAQVSIQECMACQPMKLDVWQKNAENLKAMLPRIHIDNPALVWEMFEIPLDDTHTAIGVYSASMVKEENSKASALGLDVFYNDGTNMMTIQVSARPKEGGPGSADDLAGLQAQMTKDEFVAAAKKIFAPFASTF